MTSATPPLSTCHQAPLEVVHGGEGTSYYRCSSCKNPADPYVEAAEGGDEDVKLLIFGWIVTALGLPANADPTHYNKLTDKLFELFTGWRQADRDALVEAVEAEKVVPDKANPQPLEVFERGANYGLNMAKHVIEVYYDHPTGETT